MKTLDKTIYKLSAGMLMSLGLLSLRIEGKCLKRIVSSLIALVLGVLLAVTTLHLLPNAIAGFIYGTHQSYIPQKFLRAEQR